MNSNEISLDDLFNQYTDPQQIKDSYENRTVAPGRYVFFASRVDPRVASEASPWPSRPTVSMFGALKDDDGKRKGSVGFEASWAVEYFNDRNGNKRQDSLSSLWGQLVVALDMAKESVGEVIKAAAKYPLSVYVSEGFKNPETGKYEFPNAADDDPSPDARNRAYFRGKGWQAKNFVRSISKMK